MSGFTKKFLSINSTQIKYNFQVYFFRIQSGHTFHLNYMFALLVGVLVFGYMYFRGIAIQY